MEEKLKKLKTSLDKTVYKNIDFEQSMQDKTIEKLNSRIKKKNYTPIFASLMMITVACILFLSFDLPFVDRNSASIGNETTDLVKKQSVNYLLVTKVDEGPSVMLFNINKNTNNVKYTAISNNIYIENKIYKNLITAEEFEAAYGIEITRIFELEPDAIGKFVENNNGIEVLNPFEFKHGESLFHEGVIRINQEKELVDFISMRKGDPRSDHGRNDRIISVYEELFKNEEFLFNILSIKKITAFDKVLQSASDFELENKIFMEPQYIDGVFISEISRENLELFRQTFND